MNAKREVLKKLLDSTSHLVQEWRRNNCTGCINAARCFPYGGIETEWIKNCSKATKLIKSFMEAIDIGALRTTGNFVLLDINIEHLED